jgi:glutamyl-tRNA reductase
MHQIGVVGLSYRHANAGHIAGFALPKDEVAQRLPDLRRALGVEELVYLSTCNRVELVFAVPGRGEAGDSRTQIYRALTGRDPAPGEARAALRAWAGEAAVEHVFLVACGLDSAQAGEREIAAQLRAAWEVSREAGVCGAVLDHVFGEALAMANRVQQIAAGARAPSLADLAVERMLAHLGAGRGPVALVGVSPMTRRCGEQLARAGVDLIVVNRTLESAEDFVSELDARRAGMVSTGASARGGDAAAMSLEAFRAQPPRVAGLMAATGGSAAVLGAPELARLKLSAGRPPLLVDFGLPANLEAQAAEACGLRRLGMDELIEAAQEQRIAQLTRLAPVRAAIDERLARLRGQIAARSMGPQLAELRGAFENIAAEEMGRLLAAELSSLPPAQQEQLRRFATTIARRLAHLPLAGLRAAAEHASTETVEAFFREARLRRGATTTSGQKPRFLPAGERAAGRFPQRIRNPGG